MKIWNFETSQDAFDGIIHAGLSNVPDVRESTVGYRMVSYHHMIHIHRPHPLDLTRVAFDSRRWEQFLRDYFDPATFARFWRKLQNAKSNQEISYICQENPRHHLGNCLISVSGHLRSNEHVPSTITLYSRSVMWVPTGALDLSFGSLLCHQLQHYVDSPVELVWYINQLQLHGIKSLPYLLRTGYTIEMIEKLEPCNHYVRQLQQQIHKIHDRARVNPFSMYRRYSIKINEAIVASTSVSMADETIDSTSYIPTIPPYFFGNVDRIDASNISVDDLVAIFTDRKLVRSLLTKAGLLESAVKHRGYNTDRKLAWSYDVLWSKGVIPALEQATGKQLEHRCKD